MKRNILITMTCTFLSLSLSGCINIDHLKCLPDTINKEFGEEISANIEDYFLEEVDKKNKDKITVTMDENIIINNELNVFETKNKNLVEVGEYILKVNYGEKEQKDIKLIVKDTTAPSIKEDYKQITVEQNAVDVDFTQFFTCDDLSTCKIITDDSNVDIKKVGKYTLTVSAVDEYDNKTSKDVEVNVVTLKDARKKDVITPTLDGKIYQSKELVETIKKEKEEAEAKKREEELKKQQATTNKPNNSNNLNISGTEKQHSINLNIIYGFSSKYSYTYDEIIKKDGKNAHLPYEIGDWGYAIKALNEVFYDGYAYGKCTEHENCFIPLSPVDETLYDNLTTVVMGEYVNIVNNALLSMNRNCSDYEMVTQIANWLKNRISYKITDNRDYWEALTKDGNKGQCYHYACIFEDMCRIVGVNAQYIEGYAYGNYHAWNKIKLDDTWYYSDITLYDSQKNTKYIASKQLWSTHKQ